MRNCIGIITVSIVVFWGTLSVCAKDINISLISPINAGDYKVNEPFLIHGKIIVKGVKDIESYLEKKYVLRPVIKYKKEYTFYEIDIEADGSFTTSLAISPPGGLREFWVALFHEKNDYKPGVAYPSTSRGTVCASKKVFIRLR